MIEGFSWFALVLFFWLISCSELEIVIFYFDDGITKIRD